MKAKLVAPMASDDGTSYHLASFHCSTCWRICGNEQSCLEHMLTHLTNTNENDGTLMEPETDSMYMTADVRGKLGQNDTLSDERDNRDLRSETTAEHTKKTHKQLKCEKNNSTVIYMHKRCRYCNLECDDSVKLKKHEQSHKMTLKKMYICDICQKQFTSHYRYQVHLRKHNIYHPYQCKVCSKRFYEKTNLTTHMRYHTKSGLLYCPICRREFIKRSLLVKHMEVHSEERPHKCEHCASKFKRRQHLERHLMRHSTSRPRPYRCDKCDIAYFDSLGLKRHHKNYHNHERDVIQKNFKTRFVEVMRVDGGTERQKVETINTVFPNTEATSSMSQLAGGSPEQVHTPQRTTSVPCSASLQSPSNEILCISEFPPTLCVEPVISLVDKSKILDLKEEREGLSKKVEPLAISLASSTSNVLATDPSEVPSSLALSLAPPSPIVIAIDLPEMALPVVDQSYNVIATDSSEVQYSSRLPFSSPKSIEITVLSSDVSPSFKGNRTGICDFNTEIDINPMIHLDGSVPMSMSSGLGSSPAVDAIVMESLSVLPDTHQVQTQRANLPKASKNMGGNISSRDVFQICPSDVCGNKKQKSTTVQKQKIAEIPHTLWTYI